MAQAAATNQYTPAMNIAARQAIIASSIDEWQQIYQWSGTPAAGQVWQIPLRNVGLVKRILVKWSQVVVNPNGPTQTLTTLGLANFWSNVTLTDLSNQTRINTSGWHLNMVASAKAREPYGMAIKAASTDNPFGYGVNFTNVQTAPATIASNTSVTVYGFLEIPLAYSDHDLRGAIYANVVNATFNLQLTLNPNLLQASTSTDSTFGMYLSSGAVATLGAMSMTIYQNYLDQLPVGQNGQPILPYFDLGVAYLFNNTSFSGLVANQDNPFFYANFRNFMSTSIIYDNAGTLTTNATDINYFTLQTANYTNIMKVDPSVPALWNRLRMKEDMPTGTFYFDHRKRPISTVQYGNQALVINPATVTGASSAFYFGYEMLANISQISNAGSLPGT